MASDVRVADGTARDAARPVRKRAKAGSPRRRTQVPFLLAVLVPLMAFFVFFWLYPIVRGAWGSLTQWSAFSQDAPFIGLDNYVRAAKDPVFLISLRNTVVYAFVTVVGQTVLGLVLALAIESVWRRRTFFRTVYFLSYVTPVIATAMVWKFLYQPSLGLFNQLLDMAGLPTQRWLLSDSQALLSIAGYSIWKNVGFSVVIFMAGLLAIPRDFVEAAKIDGASSWKAFWAVTLPLLRPALLFVIVTRLITTFQDFGPFFVMTSEGDSLPGGPDNSTLVLPVYQWLTAFRKLELGYGSAMGVIMFVILLAFTLLLFRRLRTQWEY